jgi:starch-binding outer membrane protein, SusD/RagB family
MKAIRTKIKAYLLLFSLIGFACTDLQEIPKSELEIDGYFTNEETLERAIVPAYSVLKSYIWSYWNCSELTTDEVQVTNYHTGDLYQLDLHLFEGESRNTEDLWNDLNQGVQACDKALFIFENLKNPSPKTSQYIAEARAMRAFYYYLLMDTFGNVSVAEKQQFSAQKTRKELFDFCENELKTVLKQLPTDAVYGRMNQSIAKVILAKIYLNAGVYTKNPKWNECLETCDAIIQEGKYSLDPDFFNNFKLQNENSKEAIWAIGFSSKIDTGWPGMNFSARTLSYGQAQNAWGIFATSAELYDSFAEKDYRKSVFLEGVQPKILTWPLRSTAKDTLQNYGNPLIFKKDFKAAQPYPNNGVRVIKYQPDQANATQQDNDFIIFRLADIMLMKAEALFQLNRKTEALAMLNVVRNRAGMPNLKEITIKSIEEERCFELYWEGFRRQDMIRFGTFLLPYSNKENPTEKHKVLFSIPKAAMQANPNLKQNEGY